MGNPFSEGWEPPFRGMAPPAGRIPLVMGGEPRRAGHPLNGGEPRRPRSRGMAAPFPSDGTPLPAARGHFPGGWQPLLRGTGAPLPRVGGDGFHEGRGPLARGRGVPLHRGTAAPVPRDGALSLSDGSPFPEGRKPPAHEGWDTLTRRSGAPLPRSGGPFPEGRVPISGPTGAPFPEERGPLSSLPGEPTAKDV